MTTAAPPRPAPTSSTRLVVTLGLAGLLSGLVLVGIYQATLPRILENEARALRAAIFEVVPGATTMRPLVPGTSGTLVAASEEAAADAVVYAAYGEDGALEGYAIAAEGAGFQDNIKIIYGFDPEDRHVVGMRVLDSRETPGLGDKIYKDRSFVSEFEALAIDPTVELVKKGEGTAENQVDAITGATISSRAIVKIINTANETWLGRLPEEAPPAPAGAPADADALPETEGPPGAAPGATTGGASDPAPAGSPGEETTP